MPRALLLDLAVLVKETKEIGQAWTENIRNVYGPYLDIKAEDMNGTIQEALHRTLGDHGLSRMEIDSKMELFINEMPYAYYNVAGMSNMHQTDGAQEALALCGSDEFIAGLATPIQERIAQNMMERARIDPKLFRFMEFGGIGRDAASILKVSLSRAKAMGAEINSEGVFVSSSPEMLSSAEKLRIKTVAVTNGHDEKFDGIGINVRVRSLKGLRKAVQKALA